MPRGSQGSFGIAMQAALCAWQLPAARMVKEPIAAGALERVTWELRGSRTRPRQRRPMQPPSTHTGTKKGGAS